MRKDFLVGIDLAKKHDFAAFVGVSRTALDDATVEQLLGDDRPDEDIPVADYEPLLLRVEYSLQVPRGTPYQKIVDHTVLLAEHPKLKGRIQFAVDVTGVGEAVLEMLEAREELSDLLWCITITPGQRANQKSGMRFSVPKKDLKDSILVKLQQKRLVANPLESSDMDRLRVQMHAFKKKFTDKRNITYEADNESDHDDLVIGLACVCWLSDKLPLEDQGEWSSDSQPLIISDGPQRLRHAGYPTWRGGGESTTHRPAGNGPITSHEPLPPHPNRRGP